MSATTTLDFNNIQGDILEGLPKRFQTFLFFQITDGAKFKSKFKAVIPFITTTQQVIDAQKTIAAHKTSGGIGLLTLAQANISFSATGLTALGISTDGVGDADGTFQQGQLKTATALGDPILPDGTPDWDPLFKQPIHACLTVTGESQLTVNLHLATLTALLLGTIKVLGAESGAVRPGNEAGHEHFGFADGLSNPPIIGFRPPNTGEDPTPAGIVLFGEDQDPIAPTRTAPWVKDSSFFVFRKLKQLVPEFHTFLDQNPIKDAGLTPEQGSALLGARLVGRWPSGAPTVNNPTQDNPADGKDKDKVNNFDYSADPNQVNCPFAAHLRKMNPRAGFPGSAAVRVRRIIRQGIPYGPEVSFIEHASGKTSQDRGLLFTCYQSDLQNGFNFLQESWADNPNFPHANNGFDAIIGQKGNSPRSTGGTDPQNLDAQLSLPQLWVIPRGGEYFIAPSISALKSTFSA